MIQIGLENSRGLFAKTVSIERNLLHKNDFVRRKKCHLKIVMQITELYYCQIEENLICKH